MHLDDERFTAQLDTSTVKREETTGGVRIGWVKRPPWRRIGRGDCAWRGEREGATPPWRWIEKKNYETAVS